jgi:hypothetical protein
MADDIEEFLKRVAEKRRGQQGNRPPAQQPKPQQQQPAQRPPPQRPASPPQQPRPPMTVSPPPVVQRSAPDNTGTAPAESSIHPMAMNDVQVHAQQYMSRAEFAERSKQAGMHAKPMAHIETNMAKARMSREPDMKSTMPREVDVFATPAPPVGSGESTFAVMMKSREAFRSAFLLSLVLDRPAWQDD